MKERITEQSSLNVINIIDNLICDEALFSLQMEEAILSFKLAITEFEIQLNNLLVADLERQLKLLTI
jgi:hypothetical protein